MRAGQVRPNSDGPGETTNKLVAKMMGMAMAMRTRPLRPVQASRELAAANVGCFFGFPARHQQRPGRIFDPEVKLNAALFRLALEAGESGYGAVGLTAREREKTNERLLAD
jgi:hypothetical protein